MIENTPDAGASSSEPEAQIKSLKAEIQQLHSEVKQVEERLSQLAEACCHKQVDELKRKSQLVNIALGTVIVLSVSLTAWWLVSPRFAPPLQEGKANLKDCLLCLAAGVLGSTTSAFISALQRRANGWEIHGIKIPPGAGERFNEKMVPFFLGRPLLGLLVGLLVYAASGGQLLFKIGFEETSLYQMVFYSLLAGLFAKSLIERLKVIFDDIFGAKG